MILDTQQTLKTQNGNLLSLRRTVRRRRRLADGFVSA